MKRRVARVAQPGPTDAERDAAAFGMDDSITLKGIKQGLLVTVKPDGRWSDMTTRLMAMIDAQSAFFRGAQIAVAVGPREVRRHELANLVKLLEKRDVMLLAVLGDSAATVGSARKLGLKTDANGNVLEQFDPQIMRTLVIPRGEDLPVLFLQEDMLLHGENSLACRCEPDSDYYDEDFCGSVDLSNYTAQFDRDSNLDDEFTDIVRYRVQIPDDYTFNQGICDLLEQEGVQRAKHYIPPFATSETLSLMQQGMRRAVTEGTAARAALPYVNVGAKTGTAEYCDDIANSLNLCKAGQWPAHAWMVGYAPYEAPEIVVIAFVYNGGEGSLVAGPIVHDVLDSYFQIKSKQASAVN